MLKTLQEHFFDTYICYWGNLSRTNNLIAILNISLFYVTQLVTHCGLYKSAHSLLCVGIVAVIPLIPLGLVRNVWFYFACVVLEGIAAYYLIESIWTWLKFNGAV